jgi:enamine deaminase RidA (YjgF/YER057c/UK114 family)
MAGLLVVVSTLFVADPANGNAPDSERFSSVYIDYFDSTAQPDLPTRTRAQVARLVEPGWPV